MTVPTAITVDEQVLKRVDELAKITGLSRSKIFSDGAKRYISILEKKFKEELEL